MPLRKLLPPRLVLLCAIGMLALDRYAPGARLLELPWTAVGLLVGAAGMALAVAGRLRSCAPALLRS